MTLPAASSAWAAYQRVVRTRVEVWKPLLSTVATDRIARKLVPERMRQRATPVAPFQLANTATPPRGERTATTRGGSAGRPVQGKR